MPIDSIEAKLEDLKEIALEIKHGLANVPRLITALITIAGLNASGNIGNLISNTVEEDNKAHATYPNRRGINSQPTADSRQERANQSPFKD